MRAWPRWVGFQQRRGNTLDPFLQQGHTNRAKAALLMTYQLYLHESVEMRAAQISSEISALKSHWTSNFQDSSFFELCGAVTGRRMARSMADTREQQAEALAKAQQRQKWPVMREMVVALHEQVWTPLAADPDRSAVQLTLMGSCLGCFLAYCFGPRVSSFAAGEGPDVRENENHAINCEDLTFFVNCPQEGASAAGQADQPPLSRTFRGTEVREQLESYPSSVVHRIQLDFISTKTAPVVGLNLYNTAGFEGMVLACCVFWVATASRVQNQDPLLTRYYRGSRRLTRQRDLTAAMKDGARRVGLPAERFSFKSNRIGLASVDGMSGASKDRVGGWAVGSRVRETSYDKRPARGRLAFEDSGGVPQSITLNSLLQRAAEER
jgi:hypothetical protein